MDKNDVIEYVMNTPHNTNRAVLSSMLNQLTEGGDDGGGSLDLSTATVTVNYVGDHSASSISGGYAEVYTDVSFEVKAITFNYGGDSGPLPVSALGTTNELKIPIYNGAKTDIKSIEFLDGENLMLPDLNNSSVVSGSAEIADNYLFVWGDCVVNLALQYAE